MDAEAGGDTTLDRLIRILSAFDADRPTLSVAALAHRADLPQATAYRWADRLVDAGLLQRSPDGGLRPGLRLWELATRSAPAAPLRQAAMPFMNDVQGVLRQHTQLAILDDEGVLILERLSSSGAVSNQATVAGRLPTWTTALGLALLAFSPERITERFVREHRTELGGPPGAGSVGTAARGSARGVVNPTEAELRRDLAEVRRTGYAGVPGLIDTETTGVAVPVPIPDGGTVAALGVVVPRESKFAAGLAPMLLAAARGIGRALDPPTCSH